MATSVAESSADISACGRFRWKLVRRWDRRPVLLVIMMNPSDADARRNDPTVSLLCFIASWNGYGGIVVMNICPFRSSKPGEAFAWIESGVDADVMLENERRLGAEATKAGAVLVAWGALVEQLPGCETAALAALRKSCPHIPLMCLGVTAGGHPLHPMARGKMKVPKDRKLTPWNPQPSR